MSTNNYTTWRDARIEQLLSQEKYDFQDLCDIVVILRGEGGCPWDREQDHHSIRTGLIEECYEVIEAIDNDDPLLLREELGDLLLQILFHADIEKDAGRFALNDVANDECVKMISRHPHVFGQVRVENSEEVLKNWDAIKTVEKQRLSLSDQLRSIPVIFPALIRAQKVGKKTGADAEQSVAELIDLLKAQLDVLKTSNNGQDQKEQYGDILFRMTSLARAMQLDSEEALSFSIERKIAKAEENSKK